jgi:hypothetical protein
MIIFWRVTLLAGCLMLTACSSTTVNRSWKSTEFTARINTPYIIGISKDELKRRVFEDRFSDKLSKYGVRGIASYKDLATSKETDKKVIAQKAAANGADSVLMVRVINERTEQVVEPGKITSTSSGPYYAGESYRSRGDYYPEAHYHDYGNYYAQSSQTIYEPPRVTNFKIVTLEANLYDAKSAKMIWSAQLDLVDDAPADKLLQDFINTAIEDMHSKGLF